MQYPFHYHLKVRSYDLDSFGHVNNAVYLNYLEEARCDYLEQCGLSFNSFHQLGALAIVVGVEIRYKRPARFAEMLDIRGGFSNVKRTSFCINYEIYNETIGLTCAIANMDFAFVNFDGKIIAIPDQFRDQVLSGRLPHIEKK